MQSEDFKNMADTLYPDNVYFSNSKRLAFVNGALEVWDGHVLPLQQRVKELEASDERLKVEIIELKEEIEILSQFDER
jgi:hypothetical protein